MREREGPDDQYVRIYNLIQEADKLNSGGQPSEALPKYLEAQTALQRFQKGYPDWNPKVISFRLNYVAAKIAAALPPGAGSATAAADSAAAKPAAPRAPARPDPACQGAAGDWEAQLARLSDQVRQLQADKAVLEAKLKEALSVQPAALDPRELARAEEKIGAAEGERSAQGQPGPGESQAPAGAGHEGAGRSAAGPGGGQSQARGANQDRECAGPGKDCPPGQAGQSSLPAPLPPPS